MNGKLGTVVVAALCAAGTASADVGQGTEATAEIRARTDAYVRVWNAHDWSGLGAFFEVDADLVMGNQPAAHGRAQIRDWWRAYFAGQESERHLTLEVSPVQFVSSNAAVMTVATTTGGRDAQGRELLPRRFRGTWVWHRQGDDWLISAMRGLPTEDDRVVLNESPAVVEALRPDVRAFVASYQDAFNAHDPAAVSALYWDGAQIIVRNSPIIRGREAIEEWWRTYFSAPRPYRAIMIVDQVRMIDPDVVLIDLTVVGAALQPGDQPLPARYARATWVAARETGRWRIVALWVLPSEDDAVIRAGDS